MILQKLKQSAEDYLGQKVEKAVITVPAYFNDAQRQATKDAGKIAGLEVMRIVNEPTAAALAYGLDKKKDETIAVFDFGGGTFDISILEVGEGVVEVKSTNGDTHLGGDDIDEALIEWIIEEFKKDQGIDLSNDKMALQRLKEAAEKAKIELSSAMETEINLPFITADQSGPKHLVMKLTRAKFEQLVEPILKRLMAPVEQAIKDAGLEAEEDRRGRSRRRLDAHPEGAGDGQGLLRQGAEQVRQPGRGRRRRRGRPGRRALGREDRHPAARRDAAVARHRNARRRHHQCSSSATRRSRRASRKSSRPRRTIRRRSRCTSCRASARWRRDNRTLGKFHLVGIPPAPRGVPQVEVTFDIDANGIVNVSAKDMGTGREQKITITASSGLSKEEIDKMMRDAESHAAEDEKKREEIEARNRLDGLVYQVEKTFSENKEKLDGATQTQVEAAIAEAKKALEEGGADRLNNAFDDLQTASHKLAEALYSSGGARRRRGGRRAGSTRRALPRGAAGGSAAAAATTTSSTPSTWTWTRTSKMRVIR